MRNTAVFDQKIKPLVFLLWAFLVVPVLSYAQSGIVTGTIVDHSGEALIGVSIQVKGTPTGTITDFDGNFSINAPEDGTLVLSYIGYVTQEIKLAEAKKPLQVVLQEDSQTLDEVVVVGYGTMQKKQVTSSVTSIGADKLPVGVGGATIATALLGKVSGLVISGTDSPNSGNTLQLRGPASITAGQTPLVVIDGMPGGDLRSLVQEDILSIDVLKDASAGAIYGTRAAAGVILVTTKNSKIDDGKVKMSYSGEVVFKQAFGKPKMMSADEYREYGVGKDWGDSADWWDEALANHPTSQKHTVTLQTGNKHAKLYTSFMYENNRGIVKFEDRTDYAGRMNASFNLLEGWLEINTHMDYRQAWRNQSTVDMKKTFRNNPTRSPYDPDSDTGYNIWFGENEQQNAIADAALYTNEGLDKWFKPDVSAKLNILPVPGLSYQQTVAYEVRQWEKHTYRSRYHKEEIDAGRTGTAELGFSKTEYLSTEGYFTYMRSLGDHYINAVAGYSYFEKNGESFDMKNRNFTNDQVKFWDMEEGTYRKTHTPDMNSNKSITERLMAYFGRLNYNYQDKYMATATIRREGSSKFARNNQWGTFWALSGGWRISEEAFMKNISWISDLKLRVGYGVTGNNNFDAKYAATMYGSDKYWLMPDGQWAYTYGNKRNYNPDLKWEEKTEWNFGLDYSLFNNRLYGKFDLYRRKVNDLIYEVSVPTPPYTKTQLHKNVGTLENKGWEFEIGGDIVRSRNWNYNMSMNFSTNSGKLLKLDGGRKAIEEGSLPSPGSYSKIIVLDEGVKIGTFKLYKYAGVDDDGKFLIYKKDGSIATLNDKAEEDRQYVGNYTPKLMIGWTQNVSYKNWDLGITCTSWLKFDVYNTINMFMGLPNTNEEFNLIKDAYKKYGHIHDNREAMDFFLEDGSFFKIQNINLGYTHDLKQYNKYIERARLYFTINNVAKFTKYSGVDPEQNVTGLKGGIENFGDIYPQTRSFTLGIQLNF